MNAQRQLVLAGAGKTNATSRTFAQCQADAISKGWIMQPPPTRSTYNLMLDLTDHASTVRFLIRDTKSTAAFDAAFAAEGIRILRTACLAGCREALPDTIDPGGRVNQELAALMGFMTARSQDQPTRWSSDVVRWVGVYQSESPEDQQRDERLLDRLTRRAAEHYSTHPEYRPEWVLRE